MSVPDSALLEHQAYVQRILAISASTLSITSGIAVLFWWFALPWYDNWKFKQQLRQFELQERQLLYSTDQTNTRIHPQSQRKRLQHNQKQPAQILLRPKKRRRIRQFRHDLTVALIIMDLFKAIILIVYPIRYLNSNLYLTVPHFGFCDALGFLTTAAIQASDFAVLALAIHTALLIFKPHFKGGLYRFRYSIYTLFFVIIPLVFAAIGLVGNSGYTAFTTWCYFVVEPLWYSLVLSWIPRFFLMILIIIIYVSIFFYVKVHLYHVSKSIQSVNNDSENDGSLDHPDRTITKSTTTGMNKSQAGYKTMFIQFKVWLSYMPGFSFLNPYLGNPSLSRRMTFGNDNSGNSRNDNARNNSFEKFSSRDSIEGHNDSEPTAHDLSRMLQEQINHENILRFNKRRSIIERQVNSILIYPLTYVLLYIFPLVQHFLHYRANGEDLSPNTEIVYWVSIIASWMKPFNCFVDTTVFVIREGLLPCSARARERRKQKKKLAKLQKQRKALNSKRDGANRRPSVHVDNVQAPRKALLSLKSDHQIPNDEESTLGLQLYPVNTFKSSRLERRRSSAATHVAQDNDLPLSGVLASSSTMIPPLLLPIPDSEDYRHGNLISSTTASPNVSSNTGSTFVDEASLENSSPLSPENDTYNQENGIDTIVTDNNNNPASYNPVSSISGLFRSITGSIGGSGSRNLGQDSYNPQLPGLKDTEAGNDFEEEEEEEEEDEDEEEDDDDALNDDSEDYYFGDEEIDYVIDRSYNNSRSRADIKEERLHIEQQPPLKRRYSHATGGNASLRPNLHPLQSYHSQFSGQSVNGLGSGPNSFSSPGAAGLHLASYAMASADGGRFQNHPAAPETLTESMYTFFKSALAPIWQATDVDNLQEPRALEESIMPKFNQPENNTNVPAIHVSQGEPVRKSTSTLDSRQSSSISLKLLPRNSLRPSKMLDDMRQPSSSSSSEDPRRLKNDFNSSITNIQDHASINVRTGSASTHNSKLSIASSGSNSIPELGEPPTADSKSKPSLIKINPSPPNSSQYSNTLTVPSDRRNEMPQGFKHWGSFSFHTGNRHESVAEAPEAVTTFDHYDFTDDSLNRNMPYLDTIESARQSEEEEAEAAAAEALALTLASNGQAHTASKPTGHVKTKSFDDVSKQGITSRLSRPSHLDPIVLASTSIADSATNTPVISSPVFDVSPRTSVQVSRMSNSGIDDASNDPLFFFNSKKISRLFKANHSRSHSLNSTNSGTNSRSNSGTYQKSATPDTQSAYKNSVCSMASSAVSPGRRDTEASQSTVSSGNDPKDTGSETDTGPPKKDSTNNDKSVSDSISTGTLTVTRGSIDPTITAPDGTELVIPSPTISTPVRQLSQSSSAPSRPSVSSQDSQSAAPNNPSTIHPSAQPVQIPLNAYTQQNLRRPSHWSTSSNSRRSVNSTTSSSFSAGPGSNHRTPSLSSSIGGGRYGSISGASARFGSISGPSGFRGSISGPNGFRGSISGPSIGSAGSGRQESFSGSGRQGSVSFSKFLKSPFNPIGDENTSGGENPRSRRGGSASSSYSGVSVFSSISGLSGLSGRASQRSVVADSPLPQSPGAIEGDYSDRKGKGKRRGMSTSGSQSIDGVSGVDRTNSVTRKGSIATTTSMSSDGYSRHNQRRHDSRDISSRSNSISSKGKKHSKSDKSGFDFPVRAARQLSHFVASKAVTNFDDYDAIYNNNDNTPMDGFGSFGMLSDVSDITSSVPGVDDDMQQVSGVAGLGKVRDGGIDYSDILSDSQTNSASSSHNRYSSKSRGDGNVHQLSTIPSLNSSRSRSTSVVDFPPSSIPFSEQSQRRSLDGGSSHSATPVIESSSKSSHPPPPRRIRGNSISSPATASGNRSRSNSQGSQAPPFQTNMPFSPARPNGHDNSSGSHSAAPKRREDKEKGYEEHDSEDSMDFMEFLRTGPPGF